jgi:HAD superfamily hydrolase (TIGR01549 family)
MAILFFDWDGTICKGEVAEEGCKKLNQMLGNPVSEYMMKYGHKDNSHFKEIKNALQNYTGVNNEHKLTQMMTNIFEINYLNVISKKGIDSLYYGMEEVLVSLQNNNHKIAFVSTSTEGIVNNSINILGLSPEIFVYANNSHLSYSKKYLFLKAKKELGEPTIMVGDRQEDILSAKGFNTKTIFCEYGHGNLGDVIFDYKIKNSDDLIKILKELKLL